MVRKNKSLNEKEKFTEEQLEEEIVDQLVQDKQKRFEKRFAEINKTLSQTKLFTFTKGKVWPILLPFFVVMSILVILPLVSILIYAFVEPSNGLNMFEITLENFIRMFTDSNIMYSLFLSVLYAFIAGLFCVLFGYPIALLMANMRSKILARNMWLLITMPMWISMLLKVLGLKSLFLMLAPTSIGTPIAIIIGMVYMFLPFAITPIYDSLESRDRELEYAAQDLGCNKIKTFWTVTIRSSMPGVITGFTLVIIQAATSLIVVHYMGDGKITLITSIIESYFFKGNDFGYGAAISVVLAALVLIIMVLSRVFSNRFETKRKGGMRKWKDSSKVVISQ